MGSSSVFWCLMMGLLLFGLDLEEKLCLLVVQLVIFCNIMMMMEEYYASEVPFCLVDFFFLEILVILSINLPKTNSLK